MKDNECLLAKSYPSTPDGVVPTYAQLVPHTRAVENAGKGIIESAGRLILKQLDLAELPWLSRLERALIVACICHDLGKANKSFQQMVRGKLDPKRQPVRHELLSALLLEDKDSQIRRWALQLLEKDGDKAEAQLLLNCVIGAVAGHHLKVEKTWEKAARGLKGGWWGKCGNDVDAS